MQKSQCPLCRETFEIEAEWIGQQAQCPFCQQMITIQSPSQLITHPGTIPGTTNITTEENPPQKSTASLVLGIVGCIVWLIPLFGFPVTVVGLILGLRRKYTVGITLNVIGLSLTLVSSAVGAVLRYQGKLF